MAKKRSGSRRKFNLRRVAITPAVSIGALTTLDVAVSAGTSAAASTLRFMSINMTWNIVDLAAAADDGFQFGVAHSDYTAAEIEECLEATTAIDIGDKVAQERANRLVRSIGVISGDGTPLLDAGLKWNGGRPMKTKLNWLMSIGDTLNVWVRNSSTGTYTSGSVLAGQGDLWVKD